MVKTRVFSTSFGGAPYKTTLADNTEWYIPEGFSPTPLGANVDCGPAILAAIIAASNDDKAGVLLGEKTYGIGPSGMSMADPTKGVGLLLSDMTRVRFMGRGKNSVLKRISNADYHILEVMRAADASVENLTLDHNATALTGSGIEANDCNGFSLNSGSTGSVVNFLYRRIWHLDCQGYGAGLQFGNYSGVTLEDLYFEGTDWDAIDIKHRATAPGPFVSEAITINRMIARNFGRSKSDNDQVAFDLRGPVVGGQFFAEDGGATAKAALRLRGGATGDASFGAQKSTIHGVHVKRNGSGYTATNYGVLNQSDFAEVTGAVAEGFTHGGALEKVGVATAMVGAKLDLRAVNCTYGGRVFASASAFELNVKSSGCDYGAYIEGDNGTIDIIAVNSGQNHLRLVAGADNNVVRSKQYIGATPAGAGGNVRNDGLGNVGTGDGSDVAPLPSMLRTRAGLAKVRSGTGNMIIACGPADSNARGTGSAADGTQGYNGWPNKLAAILKSRGINAVCDNFFGVGGYNGNFANYDNRISVSRAGMAPGLGGGLSGVGGAMFELKQAGDVLTFNPKSNCNTLDIYWYSASASNVFSYSVDGGTTTNLVGSGGVNGLVKTTIPLGALGTNHTIALTWVSGSCYIAGEDAYDNSATRVHVWNWGWHGSQTSNWTGGTQGNWSPLVTIPNFYKPDLIIGGALATNDLGSSAPLTDYQTRLTALMTACKSASDLILLTACPHPTLNIAPFVEVQKAVATALNAPVADEFAWFNKSEIVAEALGLFSASDHLHKTGAGHQVTADKVDALLRAVA